MKMINFKNADRNENDTQNFEIVDKQIISFLESLNDEKEQFKLSNEEILESELIICEKAKGKIAGIAGIRRRFGVPLFFIVVKSEFQGKRIGNSLMKRLNETVNKKYSYMILSVLKNNERAIHLYYKLGYKALGENSEAYYMFYPLTKAGQMFFLFLKLVFPLVMIIRRLVLAMRRLKIKK